jgi:hypothetical protein
VDVEVHHLAGRANHLDAVINACLDCHRSYLTRWQRCSSIPLNGTDNDVQRQWALAVGALHVLALVAYRYGLPDALAVVTWVERTALVMFPDDAPDPAATYRPEPTAADGVDADATARGIAEMARWFTDDDTVLAWMDRIAGNGR